MSVQKVRLGDLVEVVNDNEYEPLKNGLTKYVAGGHLESEKLYITRFGDIERDKEVIGSAFHRKFSKGHVLFGTRRAYLRKTGIVTFDGICANTTLVLKPKQKGLVGGLLPFIVRLEKFTEHAVNRSVGSTNPYVRWRDLAAFEFELPSEPEQLQIKETLWVIQNSIDSLENLLEKTKIYSISRRESLLTRGIGHTKFKKVKWLYEKIIEIPEEWDYVKFSEVVKTNPKTNIKQIKLPYIPMDAVDTENHNVNYSEERILNNNSNLPKFQINDILFARITPSTENGKTAIMKNIEFGLASTELIVLRVTEQVLPVYLYYYMKSNRIRQYAISQMIGGTNRQRVPDIVFTKDLFFELPSITEQQKIIDILSNINEQISQQQSHLTNLYALQDSILNSKLTKEEVIAQ